MTKTFTLASMSLTLVGLSLLLFQVLSVLGSLNEPIVTPPPQGNKTSTQMAMENFNTPGLQQQAKANQESDGVEPGDAVPIPTAEEREEMVNRLIYGTSFDPSGSSSQSSSSDQDIVLLSQRYNDDRFSDEIVGEVLNNSTRTLDKYDIDIHSAFYDSTGGLVGSEQGFIDAESLGGGDRSAFNILIIDDAIRNDAVAYDLIINDERLLEGAYINGENSPSNTDGEDSNNEDEDDDNN